MYTPSAFAETDLATIHAFIEANSFATLVSQHDGQLAASHLPILLERGAGPRGTLYGHMARANPQWRQAEGTEVLAIFSGPHAYISPSWYESPDVVPTWNYAAVHASGIFRKVDAEAELLRILEDSVHFFERGLPRPWSIDARSASLRQRARMTMGFRIEIGRLEGKWKVGQNHPAERRRKVIKVLENRPDDNSRAIAEMMQAALQAEATASRESNR